MCPWVLRIVPVVIAPAVMSSKTAQSLWAAMNSRGPIKQLSFDLGILVIGGDNDNDN